MVYEDKDPTKTIRCGILLILGLGARMSDAYAYVVFEATICESIP